MADLNKDSCFATGIQQRPGLCALSIAGSDSGAGAGIQADVRAMQKLGVLCCTAITALTAQNTRGVQAVLPTPPAMLAAQLESVLSDLPIAAVKTGLLPSAEALEVVIQALAARPLPLVIDPVLVSSSGTRFLPASALELLRSRLLPLATVVTPNWPELAELKGLSSIGSLEEAKELGLQLARDSGAWFLVKGGHGNTTDCIDLLLSPKGDCLETASPRIHTSNTHGTGCTLSAALCAGLALGLSVEQAYSRAKDLLHKGLGKGKSLYWGSGHGPALPVE